MVPVRAFWFTPFVRYPVSPVAQASSSRSRYQLRQAFRRVVLPWLELSAVQQIIRYCSASKGWLLGGSALLVLLLWNWRLVVSLGLGLMTLSAGYLLQQGQGRRLWAVLQQGWQSIDRPFLLTIGSAILAAGTSYLTLAIWQELQSSWLAIGFLLQGAAVLTVLGLLGWQIWRQSQLHRSALNSAIDREWLTDLADADPLKRLLAVRQLTHALSQNHPPLLLTPKELAESFRLMLNRETEPIVCRALLESLQVLDARVLSLQASRQPAVQVTARMMESVEREAK